MLSKHGLWSLSRKGISVKEGRQGIWRSLGYGGKERKENKGEEEEQWKGRGEEEDREDEEEEEEGKGTCHRPGSPGTTSMQAWPRLLHDVVIKTVHVFLLHPAATSARCGPGCQ